MGIDALKRRAIFLDRDGVLNHNWFNPATGAWESPIAAGQLRLCDGALAALARLQRMGFLLFLVSNQPSAAKGKCTLADLEEVHGALVRALDHAAVRFEHFYYAYGHPEAVTPEFGDIRGRKPDSYFVNLAIDEFGINAGHSWMIGDRDSDIACGQSAGLRTIQVEARQSDGKHGSARPDFHARDLRAAAAIIASAEQAQSLVPCNQK
jgi:D-glycero-D-manno-heptose 1,7-bisphosphate phosphatase